jgi:hypothetical protein
MTWVDAIPIVLLVVYAALGYFTGVMRRLIGLVSLYLACFAANAMGLQAGSILQQSSSYGTADARIYGFFGILFAVIIVIDGAAQLANSQIQLQAIVFNRLSGVIIGLVTALLLSVLVTYERDRQAHHLAVPAGAAVRPSDLFRPRPRQPLAGWPPFAKFSIAQLRSTFGSTYSRVSIAATSFV